MFEIWQMEAHKSDKNLMMHAGKVLSQNIPCGLKMVKVSSCKLHINYNNISLYQEKKERK